MLAGSRDFIEHAWVFKQRFGGAMRQAGIIAAAGVYALRHHVDRLAEDHERARRLASGLAELRGAGAESGAGGDQYRDLRCSGTGLSGETFASRTLSSHGVRFSVLGPTAVRAVTHLDIPPDGIDKALDAVRTAIGACHRLPFRFWARQTCRGDPAPSLSTLTRRCHPWLALLRS